MNGQEKLYLSGLLSPLCGIFVLENHTTMKSFIKLFFCGIFFLSFSSAFTQQPAFSTTRFLPDTSFLGITDSTIRVTIKYTGASQYIGPIGIYYTTDTSNFFPTGFYNYPQAALFPNDTLQINFSIAFDTAYFQGGNNIVVVWSSGNSIAPADSLWDGIYLKTTGAGIHENDLSSAFTIYPTLVKDFISIESIENILPKKIFITDISGRIIKVVSPAQESKTRIRVNVSELDSGIYFLDILLPDKQRVVSKFVKTD